MMVNHELRLWEWTTSFGHIVSRYTGNAGAS